MWKKPSAIQLAIALVLSCVVNLHAENYEWSCEMMDQFYTLWSDSMFGHDATHETSAWVVRNSKGTIEWKRWPSSRKWQKEIWKGSVPENLVAQVHTHSSNVDPRPSTKDSVLSQKVNVPLYTVSRKGVWKITPDGKTTRIAEPNWYLNRCKKLSITASSAKPEDQLHVYKDSSCCNPVTYSKRSTMTMDDLFRFHF